MARLYRTGREVREKEKKCKDLPAVFLLFSGAGADSFALRRSSRLRVTIGLISITSSNKMKNEKNEDDCVKKKIKKKKKNW